jgi:hypothetical protein
MKVIMRVPDEGYSGNTLCALKYISTFLLNMATKNNRNIGTRLASTLTDRGNS